MGYSTDFTGTFHLDRPLFDSQALYLLAFSRTRRMKRNGDVLATLSDPGREAVGLPLGIEGGYFINEAHPDADASILHYNRPPKDQPGLWCQWIPTADGRGIEWDQQEKFYHYIEWLQYLIDHFLSPWGYSLSGTVTWQGEWESDRGQLIVDANQIVTPADGGDRLRIATSPVAVPLSIWQGLKAIQAVETRGMSWVSMAAQARTLGYPETAAWIEDALDAYGHGMQRGFQAIETAEVVDFFTDPFGL